MGCSQFCCPNQYADRQISPQTTETKRQDVSSLQNIISSQMESLAQSSIENILTEEVLCQPKDQEFPVFWHHIQSQDEPNSQVLCNNSRTSYHIVEPEEQRQQMNMQKFKPASFHYLSVLKESSLSIQYLRLPKSINLDVNKTIRPHNFKPPKGILKKQRAWSLQKSSLVRKKKVTFSLNVRNKSMDYSSTRQNRSLSYNSSHM